MPKPLLRMLIEAYCIYHKSQLITTDTNASSTHDNADDLRAQRCSISRLTKMVKKWSYLPEDLRVLAGFPGAWYPDVMY